MESARGSQGCCRGHLGGQTERRGTRLQLGFVVFALHDVKNLQAIVFGLERAFEARGQSSTGNCTTFDIMCYGKGLLPDTNDLFLSYKEQCCRVIYY